MAAHISVCNHCGQKTYGNVKECPVCGGEIVIPEAQEGSLSCPRCRCTLQRYAYRMTVLDTCPQCGGLWLDRSEFTRLTSECDVYRDESLEPEYHRPPHPQAEGYVPCARCGQLMCRKNFGGISGVMIDMCRDCGYWLDDGELRQIRTFIASGGLEKAQDKKLARHASQLASLDTRVNNLEFMQRVLHKWNIKRWFFQGF